MGIGLTGQNRGRTNRGRIRGCTRGGRSHRRVARSRSESGKKIINSSNDRLGRVLVWKEQPRGLGRKRGCRSARSRQKAAKKVVGVVGDRDTPKGNIFEKSTNLTRNEWNRDEMTKLREEEHDENGSSSESSEYDDENGQATGDEYDDMLETYGCSFDGRPNDLQEVSDDNVNGNEEGEDDEEGDLDVEEYIKESDEEGMRLADEDGNVDPEQGTGSTSTDFSE